MRKLKGEHKLSTSLLLQELWDASPNPNLETASRVQGTGEGEEQGFLLISWRAWNKDVEPPSCVRES